MTTPLRTEVFFRAHVAPLAERRRGAPRALDHLAPVADRVLVLVLEREEAGSQPRVLGVFRVLARGDDGSYALAEPKGFDEPAQGIVERRAVSRECARARAWAWNHSMPVLDVNEFVHRVFLREAYRHGAAVAGYDLPAILGSLATAWGEGRGAHRGAWTLWFCPLRRGDARHHHRTAHPDCPGVRITPRHPPMGFFSFTRPQRSGRWHVRPHPGRWLPLREKVYAVTGDDCDFSGALALFGLDAPAPAAGSSLENRLAALLARLDATCRLAEAVLAELRRHPVFSDENAMLRQASPVPRAGLLDGHSPASVLRAYMRGMGITGPPALDVRAAGLDEAAVLGASAAAFHAPRSEVLLRGVPVRGVMLDVRSCFPASALLQGLDPWWSAAHLVVEDVPAEEVRAEVEAARPGDYDNPSRWKDLAVLCLVQPDRDLLPATVFLRDAHHEGFESVLGEVTIPAVLGPVWYTKADVLVSAWRTGRAPRILRALRFRPEGERPGLREVRFRGEVPLDPRRLVASLVKTRRSLEAQGLPHIASGAKRMCNIAAYGIAAELLRLPNAAVRGRTRSTKRRRMLVVRDGVRVYRTAPEYYEAPRPHTCWPLASFTVAGSRLLLDLVEAAARDAGGDVAMVFTDAAVITSRDGVPPERIARAVMERLEPLNPFGGGIAPFLRPQDGTPDSPEAVWFYGIASPSYTRFRRERLGHERTRLTVVLKPNGFALSIYVDPTTHRPARKSAVPDWWSDAWRYMLSLDRPGRKPPEPAWLREPATQVLAYQSPLQDPVVRRLRYRDGSPIRPFTTLYLRHYYTPRALYSWTWRDELSLSSTPPSSSRASRTYEPFTRVLDLRAHHPERKMANSRGVGRLVRYTVEATGIRHFGRETPPMVGQENQVGNAAQVGAVQVYKPVPTRRETARALAVLRRAPRKPLARLLGTTPYRLRRTLDGANPTPERRRRLVALAARISAEVEQHTPEPHGPTAAVKGA